MKKLEKILQKIKENNSEDVLTKEEYQVYHKYLVKGDTRALEVHQMYQKESCLVEDGDLNEDILDALDDVTPDNYDKIKIPGIDPDKRKGRLSFIEISLLSEMKNRGFTHKMISVLLGRSEASVERFITAINKFGYSFGTNKTNIKKYNSNEKFLSSLSDVKTVLDAFCGRESWWKNNNPDLKVTSNDINEEVKADFHEPANYLLYLLRINGCKFDIIDLDCFNSAISEFREAIKLATKGIILTFGDRRAYKNHKARKSGVKRTENSIKNLYRLPEYNEDLIIRSLQKQAFEEARKKLVVVDKYSTSGIWRVYFKIEELNYEDWEDIYDKLKGELTQVNNILHNLRLQEEKERADFLKELN